MIYTSVSSPRWQDAGHTRIVCDVIFEGLGSAPLPFCADPNDVEEHGREIFAKASAGLFGAIADYVAPPPPAPVVPSSISRRQFFEQLAITGQITEDEALAAVATGTLPQLISTFIAGLPTDQRFGAKMAFVGAGEFLRAHPLVSAFGSAQSMSSADVDAFFIAAGALG